MVAKERDRSVSFFYILILFHLFPLKYCNSIYNITPSQPLLHGQTLVSNGQVFELGLFSPNNSDKQYVGVWYKQLSPRRIVWIANRKNPLTADQASSASLRIGGDGNLELVDGNKSSLIWSTNVKALSNASIAVLLDNGDFVMKDSVSGIELWESFYHPTDTFLPSGVLGFNAKTGDNYVLTSWKENWSDPWPGDFVVGFAKHKPPEVFIWKNGTIPLWRSGPWDKSKFVGIPDMSTTYDSQFDLVEDEDKGTTYLHFRSDNSSDLFLLYISSTGVFQLLIKVSDQDWDLNWEAPHYQCDLYGICGPFGVCNETESPICKCLKGFEPKSYEDWSRGNWTSGCVRQKELFCDSKKGERDDFEKRRNVKLPDFYEYVSTEYEEVESCQAWCLDNCSCVAYSYVGGIGCLVWSKELVDIQEFRFRGEDLFIRLAHEEFVGGSVGGGGGHQGRTIIISLPIISAVVVITFIGYWLHKWRSKRKGKIKETRENFDLVQRSNSLEDTLQLSNQHDPSELPIFDFGTILLATNNFNIQNKLGQGGFGSVYKGKLPDGKEIAVKRLSSCSDQGVEEFKNEILLISKLQHRNLVKLFGCCIDKEEKLLVYEFMPNKSLDFFIFDRTRRKELTWATRYNIILGVARGLLYLHRDSCLRVIHRDLKVSNILLDKKMNPKISDFGLARIFQGTSDLANTHRVVGTLGYMAPEYAMSGIFSEKSDVFSFGVLLLEIVSGKKNTNFHYRDQQLSLIAYAWHLWSEQRTIELADEALNGSCSSTEVIRCVNVGLLCVQDRDGDRPCMPDVVFMLSNETDRPVPKQPIFTFQSSPKCETQPQSESKCSVNYDDTTSLIAGR